MTSVATLPSVTVWLGCPDTTIALPPNVRFVITLEPETPAHVACEWASTTSAVSCAGWPENATTCSWWAELLATPLTPLVLAVIVCDESVFPSAMVSSVAESEPPLGGRLPVSDKNRTLGCGLTRMTWAPYPRPLDVTAARAAGTVPARHARPKARAARSGGESL